jgi:hypothetical protein
MSMSASARVARAGRAAALALALAAGCGPVGYVSQVTRSASSAVDEARAVNAAKYAPYWWTRAVEYLHQARAEAAASDWQAANRFGRLATAAAEQAKADSIRRAADPKAMEEITPPPGSPARGQGGIAPAIDDDLPPTLAPATGDDGDAP